MTTKEKVLELLNENAGSFLSGQEMADRLFVTRAAVWKAIKALQSGGYPIEAVTNRGYRLFSEYQIPEKAVIEKFLADEFSGIVPEGINVRVYNEVESTNDTIRGFAADEITLLVSGSQTKGRGRRGRSFFSPDGTGLYLSLLIHPEMTAERATKLTCIMAVAICRAIARVIGVETQIKWVNDIFYDGKKVAGILTEGVTSIEDGGLSYVIMGAGINLYEPRDGFPADIKKTAGAILSRQTDPKMISRLCAAITACFFEIYRDIDNSGYIEEYRNRSNLIGNYVKVMQYQNGIDKSGNSYARVEGIDDECHLIVTYDDGRQEHLSTGEVSVIRY